MNFGMECPPMWDSEEGLKLASQMEEKLSKKCLCHFALGGSVMYSGSSNKDLDLIVYPHNSQGTSDKSVIVKELEKLGFVPKLDGSKYYNHPAVVTTKDGRRVDFIFVGY